VPDGRGQIFERETCRRHDEYLERKTMRTFTGQRIFCVPALLLLSIGGSTHLSLEKVTAQRTVYAAARVDGGSTEAQSAASKIVRPMIASWYGLKFQGRRTSSGDRFDRNLLTAAHKTLPMGSVVRLTAPMTGRSVIVRINDRGPWIDGRDFDLSEAAALKLGIHERGIAAVEAILVR
jgi:rare lipoprotein A (peptidoglycan hydrolase)